MEKKNFWESLSLVKKYLLTESVFALAAVFFGILSSGFSLVALGVYSFVGVFCVAAAEVLPGNKVFKAFGTGVTATVSVLTAWLCFYSALRTIGYADSAVDFWALLPLAVIFFTKATLAMLYSEEEEPESKKQVFDDLVDYKYDFLLIVSSALGILATFFFDFYVEQVVAMAIGLCCLRKIYLLHKNSRGTKTDLPRE